MEINVRETVRILRSSIAANVAQSREIRRRIHESKGRARYDAWNDKRTLGFATRDMLLALAFVRGRAYRTVEPKCDCGPYVPHVARMIDASIVSPRTPEERERFNAAIAEVQAWIDAPVEAVTAVAA